MKSLKVFRVFLTALCIFSLTTSCGGDNNDEPTPSDPPTPAERIPIKLSASLSAATRATDDAFENGDQIGLFVVNYSGSMPGMLQVSGNHADNHLFTYKNDTWQPSTTIYWKDETTHADFYAYCPRQASIGNVNEMPFSVKTDQKNLSNREASDFLWGKATNLTPTSEPVNLTMRHLMSCIDVKLVAGEGFTEASLNAANPTVSLINIQTTATINLTDGALTAAGNVNNVSLGKYGGMWTAFIVPQTVESEEFLVVRIKDIDYIMPHSFTFKSGYRHTFSIAVSHIAAGINVTLTGWEEDPNDNGGTAQNKI